jgi:hypothetical protein
MEFYEREYAVYERLRDHSVTEVLGFHVPQFIRTDDGLQVIEMSIVTRPFVLDFAGAYLEVRPDFSDETWAAWEAGSGPSVPLALWNFALICVSHQHEEMHASSFPPVSLVDLNRLHSVGRCSGRLHS